ncbi:NADH-cytochrome b5 reductase [Scheffersomyces spartinae]|uniref:NADH-cytochrome b5 reductase n=1 Tax=Scheffersomyces spartinae TaxID=45513 RepID=A0A9P8AIY3_9ASCO|nr:NADH-cytochrome b5 reductase [Scheffersomyces spartinae]KAG7194279.1 NADH-cytochrome b5 reductase [Scheffersomyces spartinae]
MSFLSKAARTVSSPRVLYPFLALGTVGVAYHFSTMSAIYNENSKTFKGDDKWVDLKLIKSYDLSSNTKHFVFATESDDDVSGLQTASCVLAKFVTPKGSNVIRPYTPVSDTEQKGTIEFVIKKYEGGKMSSHLFNLKENDTLSFKGPIVKWKWEPNQFKEITLIGGGTGITPLYQLVHEITKNPQDNTKVHLIYGNLSPKDILMKKELDEYAAKHKDQVKVTYFVDKAESNWDGKTGYITKEYLESELPKPSKESKIFVCGPPPLYNAISGNKVSPTDQGEVTGILADLGFTKEHVFKF